METIILVLGIHVVEIVLFIIYVTFKKNKKLEKVVSVQQEQLNAVSFLLGEFNESLDKLDEKAYVESDPELLEVFDRFKELKSTIQSI